MVDITDRSNPAVVGNYSTGGFSLGSTSANGVIYIADAIGGLKIFKSAKPPSLSFEKEGGLHQLSLTGDTGSEYEIEYSVDILPGHWTGQQNITLTNTNRVILKDFSVSGPQGFYRAKLK